MFLSMTGFSRVSHSFSWGTFTFELSSVNHRYQELTVRLPHELSSLEPTVTSKMRSLLGRGKLRLNGEIIWNPELKAVNINTSVLENYWRVLTTTAKQLDEHQNVSITSLLSMPGVSDSPRNNEYIECELLDTLDSLLKETVDALIKVKQAEGVELLKDILHNLSDYARIIDSIESSWQASIPDALMMVRQRLDKFLTEAAGGLKVDENRLAQEVAILSDKWDISEELVRSHCHIEKFKEIMNAGAESDKVEPVGRKLDFLIQEMNREINTIGSKVPSTEQRWAVVEAKSSLERIREQIQNVE